MTLVSATPAFAATDGLPKAITFWSASNAQMGDNTKGSYELQGRDAEDDQGYLPAGTVVTVTLAPGVTMSATSVTGGVLSGPVNNVYTIQVNANAMKFKFTLHGQPTTAAVTFVATGAGLNTDTKVTSLV